VFVERKTHRESWKGEESVKERFTLDTTQVVPFLEMEYDWAKVGGWGCWGLDWGAVCGFWLASWAKVRRVGMVGFVRFWGGLGAV
jgi:hypothetical protein